MPRFQKRVIKRLKRRFGLSVDINRTLTSATNLATGEKTRTRSVIHVKKVLVLKSKELAQFDRDLSYLMAARDFSMGGYFTLSNRIFIFDASDVSSIRKTDYLVYENKRFEIKQLERYDSDAIILVVGSATENERPNQIFERQLFEDVFLGSETDNA